MCKCVALLRTEPCKLATTPCEKSVVTNLPQLLANQTLYSWCAHVHAMNAGRNAIATSSDLFDAPYAAQCHDFPYRLRRLVAKYPLAHFDEKDLALKHTLLGYFLALQPRPKAQGLLRAVTGNGLPSIKMRLGITASRVGGHHPLKGCATCISEDLDNLGHAYWHLEHQWPSSMACALHQRPLFIAWDPVTPVHRRDWLLPIGGPAWSRIEIPIRDDRQLDRLLKLSSYSQRLARSRPAGFDPHRLARCYQAGLRRRGFATASGSLRLKTLIEETRQHYRGIENIPGFEALASVTPDWPGLVGAVARSSPRYAHPLKHLLVIALIFDTWEQFLEHYKLSGEPVDSPANQPDERQLREEGLTRGVVRLVESRGLSLSAAARKLGIATTTATQIAKRQGISFTPRPKELNAAKVRQIEQLLRKGLPSRQVAELTHMSVVTINRLLAANADLKQAREMAAFLIRRKQARRAFQLAAQRCNGVTVSQLRRVQSSNYMWLYRHDREWLRAMIPALWN